MKVCGIVTEYNPMHIGHHYQVNEGKKMTQAEATVLIMSGQFVQRGEPALMNKFLRAEAALQSGIDLVIELPTVFATSSAESFSYHAIKLLDALKVVTHINFGSESGDIEPLKVIADLLVTEPLGYCVLLNRYLSEGVSYPKAREKALMTYNEQHMVTEPSNLQYIQTPNNILGIEYIKALKRLNSPIIATTIKRIGAGYHDEDSFVKIPSATSIRQHLKADLAIDLLHDKMPAASYAQLVQLMKDYGPIFVDDLFASLKYKILTTSAVGLSTYLDVTEGLENRLKQAIIHSYDYASLMSAVMTKRYTRTKISRALLHIYLGVTKDDFTTFKDEMNPYIRVLGFNKIGQQLLKEAKHLNETLPIIVNTQKGYHGLDPLQQKCFSLDLQSTMLYNHLVSSKYGVLLKNDYETPVLRL